MVSPHLAPTDKFSIVRASLAAMVNGMWHHVSNELKCQSGAKMDLLLQTCTQRTKVSKDWINEIDCFVSGPTSKIRLALIIDWLATVLKCSLGVCVQYVLVILGVALRVKNSDVFYKNGM